MWSGFQWMFWSHIKSYDFQINLIKNKAFPVLCETYQISYQISTQHNHCLPAELSATNEHHIADIIMTSVREIFIVLCKDWILYCKYVRNKYLCLSPLLFLYFLTQLLSKRAGGCNEVKNSGIILIPASSYLMMLNREHPHSIVPEYNRTRQSNISGSDWTTK